MGRKVEVKCSWCGRKFWKLAIELHERNFCCRDHLNQWNRDRISAYNKDENPLNRPEHFTLDVRLAKHQQLAGRGQGKTYKKLLGRHEHRRVAEEMLGRPLLPGEVVHHVDANKLNNSASNLAVMSKREHAAMHARQRWEVVS